MNRLTRRLAARAQRRGLIAPSAAHSYFAPPRLVEQARAAGLERGASFELVDACIRLAQVRADRDRRPLRLDDVVALLEGRQ